MGSRLVSHSLASPKSGIDSALKGNPWSEVLHTFHEVEVCTGNRSWKSSERFVS